MVGFVSCDLDARDTSDGRVVNVFAAGGRDSVEGHGDYVARRMPEAVVATVSLGEPRRFAIRPSGGGNSRQGCVCL